MGVVGIGGRGGLLGLTCRRLVACWDKNGTNGEEGSGGKGGKKGKEKGRIGKKRKSRKPKTAL